MRLVRQTVTYCKLFEAQKIRSTLPGYEPPEKVNECLPDVTCVQGNFKLFAVEAGDELATSIRCWRILAEHAAANNHEFWVVVQRHMEDEARRYTQDPRFGNIHILAL